ncbi:MAG: hypothetical protein ACI9VI_001755 [Candidatus Azotimanducaceae bacterium]|jgi:hypothetical protein
MMKKTELERFTTKVTKDYLDRGGQAIKDIPEEELNTKYLQLKALMPEKMKSALSSAHYPLLRFNDDLRDRDIAASRGHI